MSQFQKKSLFRSVSLDFSAKYLAVLVLASSIAISACKKKTNGDLAQNLGAETIRIGEVGSMTGSDATFGISTHNAISLVIAEVNAEGGIQGKKLELITLDDQGKASEAVLNVSNLINNHHVQAILGEVASSLSLAMAPIAQQFKVPMISPSSLNSKLTEQGDYIFRVCFIDKFQSKVMANFAFHDLKKRKVAILRDIKSDYSRDSAKYFSDVYLKEGGEIVLDQSYSAGDIDFKSQLTAIRAANPDLILVPGYYTEAALIARQRVELGISAPLLGGDGWDSPKLKEIGGSALDGSYFVGHFSPEDPQPLIRNFVQKYRSTFGQGDPDGNAAMGYDAARVLVEALKKSSFSASSGGSAGVSKEKLRDAIASTKDFQGVTGKITLGPTRDAILSATMFRISGGGTSKPFRLVSP